MIEQFTIRDTEAGFAAWLQAYGRAASQADFFGYTAGDYPERAIVHGTPFGIVELAIGQESPDRLTATLELDDSVSTDLKAYVAALAVAIRRKWGDNPITPDEGDRERVRIAQRRNDNGETWADIAQDIGLSERQLRRLRDKYGTG